MTLERKSNKEAFFMHSLANDQFCGVNCGSVALARV